MIYNHQKSMKKVLIYYELIVNFTKWYKITFFRNSYAVQKGVIMRKCNDEQNLSLNKILCQHLILQGFWKKKLKL